MMNMPKMAIVFGLLLTILGFVGYFGAKAGWFAAGHASMTALIPGLFGVLLMICGIVAFNPDLRKHAMHAAAMISLLGVIGAIVRPIMVLAESKLGMSSAFAGRCGQFQFCSTVCTYGVKIPPYVVVDEKFPQEPISNYGKNKLACEQIFLRAHEEKRLNLTIVRPSSTYGPGGRMIDQLEF